ncbi:hypothetical protein [Hyphomicrobium sp. NDB2Meth4]|uniref:hypothetical protein n=1 Tax=Hyphomicrobium sp. NDB2Meth4 TaxID=1892846 RepID=UPI00093094C9|nr:hypothetical protein [Hyphomicrobium sp. NDB2Meth4]
MGRFSDRVRGAGSAENAAHGMSPLEGGKFAAVLSAIALAISGYSLWETSLKQADVRIFVPPVVQYSAPYQNSNFEMIAVPVTMTNEGARTATILSMQLAVTDPRTQVTKHFYAADFGRWTMERTRTGAYEPFAPVSLAGRSSRTESVLFYTRGDGEKPAQLIEALGPYNFELTFDVAETKDKPTVKFDRSLLYYDARAFNERTLPMYSADWQSSSNAKAD